MFNEICIYEVKIEKQDEIEALTKTAVCFSVRETSGGFCLAYAPTPNNPSAFCCGWGAVASVKPSPLSGVYAPA